MRDRGIYPDDFAEMNKARIGEKYRPSNGTEGEIFESAYCDGCSKSDGGCLIRFNVMMLNVDNDGYPAEWQYGTDGQPTCTAFEEKG